VADVIVSVSDDETAGVSISVATLSIDEGTNTGTYTVVLDSQPSGAVTVTPQSGDEQAATVSGALTFTNSNWNTAQTVTVTGVQDDNAADNTATVSHAVAGADYQGVMAGGVEVTVTDDDTASVSVSVSTLDVDEGAEGTYTVQLGTEPSGAVVITPSSSAQAVATVSGALTFTAGDWNTAQTVTVTGVQDDNAADDTATVSHTVTGADYGMVTAANVEVTVTDRVGIAIAPQNLTVAEEGSGVYTAVLGSAPTGNVIITPSSDNTDVTLHVEALTFTTSNWSTAQTVTVSAAKDADGQDEMVLVSHTVSGYGSISSAASVTVMVEDNDAGVRITPMTALSVSEGGSEVYTMVLQVAPDADVVVTPSVSGNAGDLSVTPSGALTFTSVNWSVHQTVTVAAAEDDDAVNDTATLSHTLASASGNYQVAEQPADVIVSVNDNDSAGVDIAPLAASVVEGQSNTETYTVALASAPVGGAVTVTPASSNDAVATVSGALTFTSSNWNTRQTVTVTGVEDDDTEVGTATVSHTVSGADYGIAGVTAAYVIVSVTDNDTPSVSVSVTTLTVNEGAESTYTVQLGTEPNGDVTITPDSGDTGAATVLGALTFGTSTWNVPQTVTVAAAQDDDAADETVTVSHTVGGANYGGVMAAGVEVTVTDDETPGVSVSTTTLTVDEGGIGIYTMVLASQPVGGEVIVRPTSADDQAAMVSGALTFRSNNWNTAQTMTVTGVQDADTEDDTVSITHAVSGADYGTVTAAAVVVTVRDDDTPSVGVSVTTLTVREGQDGAYTMQLNTEPNGEVTITPDSGDDDVATVLAVLTFNAVNWSTAQTVTVTGAEDADTENDTVTVSHMVSGANYGTVTAASVTVTVTDNDIPSVIVSAMTLTVNEGAERTYTVQLGTEPSGEVVIRPGSGDNDVATVSAALTFNAGNWSTAQMVTVTGAQDADAVDDTVTVSHEVSGAAEYAALSGTDTADVTVTVTDDESAVVTIEPLALTVDEDDGTGVYTVVLTSEPADGDDVVVTPTSADDQVAMVSGALTFSTRNWSTRQTVTVTGVEDGNAVADTVTVSHMVSGADYDGVPAAGVEVTVTDNDIPSVIVSAPALSVDEGAEGIYTVQLGIEPSGAVMITPGSSDADVATVSGVLTFTTSNWSTAQTVTVTGVGDLDAVDDTATVSHAVSGAAEYAALSGTDTADVTVTVTDISIRGITVSENSLSVTEDGGTATYTVMLDTQPVGGVVMVTPVSGSAVATVSGALTFDAGNWNMQQTVTVTGVQDPNLIDDTAIVSHRVSGADYDGMAVDSDDNVAVTVTDTDTAMVAISPTTLTVSEGRTGTYTVRLLNQPTGSVTIIPISSDTTVATLSGAPVFNARNWNIEQTVTVTGSEDHNARDNAAVVSHRVVGDDAQYSALRIADIARVSVTVTDNDTRGIAVTPDELTVSEGATATYSVVLDTEPEGDVTVTTTSGDALAARVVPGALTFGTGNWNTAQRVSVFAIEDDDDEDGTVTISHAVRGADYTGVTVTETVVVTLNEGMPTDVNEVILPELARAIGATQLNSVTSRIDKLRAGSGAAASARLGGHSTLEDLASRRAQGMVDGNIDMKEVLGKSGFVMPLGGGLGAGEGGGFGSGMVFWGEGEYRGIGGKDKGLDWDGNLLSFSMGMDGHLREGLVGGLMVSWSDADLEYKDDSTNNGEYDLEITSLVPYAGWSVLDGQIDLWAMGGYGIGDLDVKADRNEPVLSSDVNMWSLGLGGSGALVEYGENEVRLKAEVFMTRAEVDGSKEVGGSFIPQSTANTHRMRLLLETSRTRLLASGASLTPSGEAGLRYDGGDGRTGGGAEMGGGLKYRDGGRGLTLEGRARVLLGHSADYEDWGVSGSLQLDAGADGQGLTLSLSPAYGKTSSGTQGIWSNGLFDSDSEGDDLHARMDVKMGYGVKAFTDTGLLVPYSEMSFGANGNRGYRLGVEWASGEQFQLKLFGDRKEKDNAAPTHGVQFKAEIRF